MKRSDLLSLLLGVASAALFFEFSVLPGFEPASISEVRRADSWTERYEVCVPIDGGGYRTEQRTRTTCCVPLGPMRIMSDVEVAKKRSELKAMGLL